VTVACLLKRQHASIISKVLWKKIIKDNIFQGRYISLHSFKQKAQNRAINQDFFKKSCP